MAEGLSGLGFLKIFELLLTVADGSPLDSVVVVVAAARVESDEILAPAPQL